MRGEPVPRVLLMVGLFAPAACLFPSLGGLSEGSADATLADSGGDTTSDAFAFVQANSSTVNDASIATISFKQPVTAGDTLIVCVDWAGGGTMKVTDSLGNAFSTVYVVGSRLVSVAFDVRGGIDLVSLDLGVVSSEYEIYVHEYRGVRALDFANGMNGTGDAMSSGPIDVTEAPELLFGFGPINGGSGVAGEGFTQRTALNGNITEDMVVTDAGTLSATAVNLNGSSWTMIGASFKGF